RTAKPAWTRRRFSSGTASVPSRSVTCNGPPSSTTRSTAACAASRPRARAGLSTSIISARLALTRSSAFEAWPTTMPWFALASWEVAGELRFLDDGADAGERFAAPLRHGQAAHPHRTGGGRCEAEQHADKSGLAGPVRAEVAKGRAARNPKLDTANDRPLAE